jgi:hypothetical protein
MAQKKKKGPPPRSKDQPKRKRLSTRQIVSFVIGAVIVLSMLISMIQF